MVCSSCLITASRTLREARQVSAAGSSCHALTTRAAVPPDGHQSVVEGILLAPSICAQQWSWGSQLQLWSLSQTQPGLEGPSSPSWCPGAVLVFLSSLLRPWPCCSVGVWVCPVMSVCTCFSTCLDGSRMWTRQQVSVPFEHPAPCAVLSRARAQ